MFLTSHQVYFKVNSRSSLYSQVLVSINTGIVFMLLGNIIQHNNIKILL